MFGELRTWIGWRGMTTMLVAVYLAVAAPVVLQTSEVNFLAVTALLGVVLLMLSAIDLRRMRLPDALTLPLLAAGLIHTWLARPDLLAWHGLAAITGYLALVALAALYRRRRGRDGLGRGDAKLLAAGGAWVGIDGLTSIVLFAALTALLGLAAISVAGHKVDRHSRIPFGPFLALGIWVIWLWGPLV